jgi:hypothetical protein
MPLYRCLDPNMQILEYECDRFDEVLGAGPARGRDGRTPTRSLFQ